MELWAQRCSVSGCEGKQEMAVRSENQDLWPRDQKDRKRQPKVLQRAVEKEFKVQSSVPSLLLRALWSNVSLNMNEAQLSRN